jgi:hypothetical protein
MAALAAMVMLSLLAYTAICSLVLASRRIWRL